MHHAPGTKNKGRLDWLVTDGFSCSIWENSFRTVDSLINRVSNLDETVRCLRLGQTTFPVGPVEHFFNYFQ